MATPTRTEPRAGRQREQAIEIAAAAALLVLFVIMAFFAARFDRFFFDLAILRRIQGIGGWFGPIADFSNGPLNEVGLPVIAIAGGALALWRRRFDLAAVVIAAYIARWLSTLAKELVERPRPVGDFVIKTPETFSFPSGHMMGAMMVFGASMLIAPALLPRWAVGPVWAFCVVAIVVTGVSRSWVGAHWPSDWLGSFVLGLAVLLLLHAAMPLLARWLDRSPQRP